MRQLIMDLYWETKRHLEDMQKSKMSLTDRINYEKALVKLEMIKKLLDNHNITVK